MGISSGTDRRLGALVGLAVGDALGAAVEFQPSGSFEPIVGYRGGGTHRLGSLGGHLRHGGVGVPVEHHS